MGGKSRHASLYRPFGSRLFLNCVVTPDRRGVSEFETNHKRDTCFDRPERALYDFNDIHIAQQVSTHDHVFFWSHDHTVTARHPRNWAQLAFTVAQVEVSLSAAIALCELAHFVGVVTQV